MGKQGPVRWWGLLLAGVATAATGAPAPDLWPYWDVHDPASERRVVHSDWQALLDAHVITAADGQTYLRYGAFSEADRRQLDAYVAGLTAIDPRTLQRPEQLAYWINLYNALTVRVVLDHPRKKSILRMGRGLFSIGPWNDPVAEVAGQETTLNDIEHRILRPIWRDHRIHYAVNCASVGCPNLARTAYTGEAAEHQLQAAERAFVSHPRAVRYDDRGTLWLSRIYDWYLEDFAPDEPALLEHLARVHPTLGERLRAHEGRIRYEYDWALNAPPD